MNKLTSLFRRVALCFFLKRRKSDAEKLARFEKVTFTPESMGLVRARGGSDD